MEAEGREEGIDKGEKNEKIRTATKLLPLMSLEEVAGITELSPEELEKLKNDM